MDDFIQKYSLKGAIGLEMYVEKNMRNQIPKIGVGKDFSSLCWVSLKVRNNSTQEEDTHHFSVGVNYYKDSDEVRIMYVNHMVPGEDEALDQLNEFGADMVVRESEPLTL